MEETIKRKVGRPRGGRLNLEEQAKAKIEHYEHVKQWKLANPEAVKQYYKTYSERRRNGTVKTRNKIDILQALLKDIKNVTIV